MDARTGLARFSGPSPSQKRCARETVAITVRLVETPSARLRSSVHTRPFERRAEAVCEGMTSSAETIRGPRRIGADPLNPLHFHNLLGGSWHGVRRARRQALREPLVVLRKRPIVELLPLGRTAGAGDDAAAKARCLDCLSRIAPPTASLNGLRTSSDDSFLRPFGQLASPLDGDAAHAECRRSGISDG